MVKALFDTNILIDYLNGVAQAEGEIGRYQDGAISVITWMEVMVGSTPETDAVLRAWLRQFTVLPIDERISDIAVALRKKYRIRLPDAIIWASAQAQQRLLITRNTKDFPAQEPGVRMPYSIDPAGHAPPIKPTS
jgi:predicted nucleic acid-binding protein